VRGVMEHILHSFYINGQGQAKALPPEEALKKKPRTGFIWLHLDATSDATAEFLREDPGVDNVAARTLLAEDSRPRAIVHESVILINLRGVNLNPHSRPEDMVRIRFLLQEHRVITVQPRVLKATSDIVDWLETQTVSSRPGGFIARYALLIAARMNPTIVELNEQVDRLEETVDSDTPQFSGVALTKIRRKAIMLRRYMAPQKDALMGLALHTVDWITEADRLRIREAGDEATRVAEDLEAIRERCAVVKDQLSDQRAEMMNRNMMILSVVAAIFLPLSLISGMMGINVGGMPWIEDGMGFWYVVFVVGIVGIIQIFIFKKLKWL